MTLQTPVSRLAAAAREAADGTDAVLIWSTNLPGWHLPALLDATTLGTEALLAAAGLPEAA